MAGNCTNPSSPSPWRALEDLKSPRRYQEHALLFREGEPCAGVYLVEKGQIQLSLPVRPRQQKVFEIAGPGAVLGLSEVMTGMSHKLTAEAAGPVEVAYIERTALIKFLGNHHEVCMQIVRLLSEDLHGLYQRLLAMAPVEAKAHRKASSSRVD